MKVFTIVFFTVFGFAAAWFIDQNIDHVVNYFLSIHNLHYRFASWLTEGTDMPIWFALIIIYGLWIEFFLWSRKLNK